MALKTKFCQDTDVSPLVYLLVGLFGIGSWIAVNGLWVELPLLVQRLPEAWDLPSYLVIIIQLANIGPITYTLATTLSKGKLKEKPVVCLMVIVGATSCLLLAFFWESTSFIGGAEHSTALFVLAFCLAMVDCTSSVVFLPFMSIFKPSYITALYIGEGFSGLVPSLIALAQGVGGNPECKNKTSYVNVTVGNLSSEAEFVYVSKLVPVTKPPLFGIEVFFYFLFAMMLVCGVAFVLLNYLPKCREEQTKPNVVEAPVSQDAEGESLSSSNNSNEMEKIQNSTTYVSYQNTTSVEQSTAFGQDVSSRQVLLKRDLVEPLGLRNFVILQLINAWINALGNGVLPSIQSYSCLPYGNTAYHLAVSLANISNPIACFFAFLYPVKSKTLCGVLTVIASGFATFIIYLAAMSPNPPLVGEVAGEIIVVLVWIVFTSINSFIKVTIASIFRDEGRKALIWCGGITQAGSAVGALTTFFLVNKLHLFKSIPPCTS
ncbi:solute carrier family 52, riboflavin transporter, member 3-B-like [Lineus longissimus]|uniref:solute carrier family 52, riboflavin transporter, member 3-B-like n=1 Tax=Lineus longissimus TaxID=88925 RepID=UPI002B4C9588